MGPPTTADAAEPGEQAAFFGTQEGRPATTDSTGTRFAMSAPERSSWRIYMTYGKAVSNGGQWRPFAFRRTRLLVRG